MGKRRRGLLVVEEPRLYTVIFRGVPEDRLTTCTGPMKALSRARRVIVRPITRREHAAYVH